MKFFKEAASAGVKRRFSIFIYSLISNIALRNLCFILPAAHVGEATIGPRASILPGAMTSKRNVDGGAASSGAVSKVERGRWV